MTEILGLGAGAAMALAAARWKARQWSRLIRQGGDLVHRGRGEEAEASLRAALRIADSARGPLWFGRRLATLLPLAHLLLHRGQYEEAAEAAVEYVEAARRQAIDSATVARGLSLLGDICAARGSLAEAEALYRATLEMEERLLGANCADLAPTLVKLGSVLQSMTRRGEAAVLFRRCSDLVSG